MQHVLLSQAQDTSSSGDHRTELLSYSQFMQKVSILPLPLLCHLEGIPRAKLYCCSSFHSLHGLLPPCMSYVPLHEFTGLMHLIQEYGRLPELTSIAKAVINMCSWHSQIQTAKCGLGFLKTVCLRTLTSTLDTEAWC